MKFPMLAHRWRLPKVIIALLVTELPLTVVCLLLFGIAQGDTYQTKLWENGYVKGFNSGPTQVVYDYTTYHKATVPSRSFAAVALCSVTMGCIAGLAASAAQPSQLFVGTRTGQPALRAQVEKIPAVAQTILNAQRQPLQEIPETSVAQSAPHAWSLASLLAPLVAFAGLAVWGLSGGSKKQSLADLEHGQWAMAASQAELRKRLASVKNSKKITDAMKLVASAKLRRAQEAVVQSRPFSEALQGVFGEVIRRKKSRRQQHAASYFHCVFGVLCSVCCDCSPEARRVP